MGAARLTLCIAYRFTLFTINRFRCSHQVGLSSQRPQAASDERSELCRARAQSARTGVNPFLENGFLLSLDLKVLFLAGLCAALVNVHRLPTSSTVLINVRGESACACARVRGRASRACLRACARARAVSACAILLRSRMVGTGGRGRMPSAWPSQSPEGGNVAAWMRRRVPPRG